MIPNQPRAHWGAAPPERAASVTSSPTISSGGTPDVPAPEGSCRSSCRLRPPISVTGRPPSAPPAVPSRITASPRVWNGSRAGAPVRKDRTSPGSVAARRLRKTQRLHSRAAPHARTPCRLRRRAVVGREGLTAHVLDGVADLAVHGDHPDAADSGVADDSPRRQPRISRFHFPARDRQAAPELPRCLCFRESEHPCDNAVRAR